MFGNRSNHDVTIIIPAYNEESSIARTIFLINKTDFNGRILVVNDGSTDKTRQIAENLLGERNVISLDRNQGKSNAFFAGIREALKTNPEIVVTIDADMLEIPKESLNKLILESRNRKGPYMCISMGVFESAGGTGSGGLNSEKTSGIRSFNSEGLRLLERAKGIKKYSRGFQLERFLNWFYERFPKAIGKLYFEKFVAEMAYRKGINLQGGQAARFKESRKRLTSKANRRAFFKALEEKRQNAGIFLELKEKPKTGLNTRIKRV